MTPGLHATDLVPLFYNTYYNATGSGVSGSSLYAVPPGLGNLAATYQQYATSHARTGDPNSYLNTQNQALFAGITWPHPGSLTSEEYTNVLNIGNTGLTLVADDQVLQSHCDFVMQYAVALTNVGGYAVPGTVQKQGIVAQPKNSSTRYVNACSLCKE